MSKREGGGSGELLQILILTLSMTAGGFLLLFIVLRYWLIPGVESDVAAETKQYEGLVTLLQSEELNILRQQAREQEESAQNRPLNEIIVEQLASFGVEHGGLAKPRLRELGGGLEEETRSVQTQPSSLRQILQFAVAVRDAKKTVRVARINFQRAKTGRRTTDSEPEDAWTADIDFVDYTSKT